MERDGRNEQAQDFYQKVAADRRGPDWDDPHQQALRGLDRLRQDGIFLDRAELLAQKLWGAIQHR